MKQLRTVFCCPKRLIKRTLCLLLCLLLLLPLSACGETTALSYGGVIIDEGMYRYWLSYYKYAFLSAADQADDPAFFDQNMPGSDTTWGEYYETQFRENVNALLMGAVLFDQYDLTISDDVQPDIDQYLSGQISRFGSEDALNQALSPMGIDNNKLRKILIFEAKLSAVSSYLYGDTSTGVQGTVTISDEDVNAFYEEHYAAFQLILIRTDAINLLNDDGSVQTDETGAAQTRPLTQEELAQKEAQVQDIEARLDNGEDFSTLQAQYNQDRESATFPDGYLVGDFYSVFQDDLTTAVRQLEIGAYTVVQDNYGYEIVKRVELPAAPWANGDYSTMMTGFTDYLNSSHFADLIASDIPNIRENTRVTSQYSLPDADISFFTYNG